MQAQGPLGLCQASPESEARSADLRSAPTGLRGRDLPLGALDQGAVRGPPRQQAICLLVRRSAEFSGLAVQEVSVLAPPHGVTLRKV